MAIKKGNKWLCPLCFKEFTASNFADMHVIIDHDAIYVPFEREELNRLLLCLMSGDMSLLPEAVYLRLQKFLKNSIRREEFE